MSQQNPEEIRADIEATRARLGSDVDAVSEKVTPERVVDRQRTKARDKAQDVRERIMGPSDSPSSGGGHLKESVQDHADQARGAVQSAPATAKAKTRGNPFAAGLIALGTGWLIGSMLPSSQKEQELTAKAAHRAQPHAQSAAESAKGVAKDAAKNVAMTVAGEVKDLKEPAKEAAKSVKDTAQSGAQEVKQESKAEGQHLKSSTQDSAHTVKGETRNT